MSATVSKTRPTISPAGLYGEDFYTWTQDQAAALRSGRLAALDLEHLAEEIGDLGKAEFGRLESALRVLLMHMLKWDHQPERRSRSWANSISAQRAIADYVLRDNPGLKPRLDEAVERAFKLGRLRASTEMRRDVKELPETCPYTFDEIRDRRFEWPEG